MIWAGRGLNTINTINDRQVLRQKKYFDLKLVWCLVKLNIVNEDKFKEQMFNPFVYLGCLGLLLISISMRRNFGPFK